MKVAIYSLTRDRAYYTQTCFNRLHKCAAHPFDHYVIDNGSKDKTVDWLKTEYSSLPGVQIDLLDQNCGISFASNLALKRIFDFEQAAKFKYDLIVKMDNDCFIESDKILHRIVNIYNHVKQFGPKFILSPYVNGIVNQPKRGATIWLNDSAIGLTAIVGGLFHCVPAEVYNFYRYPEALPLAKGQDDHFCNWAKEKGCQVGYIEDLFVQHYETTDGQAKRYPSYFVRKQKEEATTA